MTQPGTISIEFIPSVGPRGVYAIRNRKEAPGSRVFHFLTGLEKRGAFEGRVSLGYQQTANFISAERKDQFVAHAEANGFHVERA